MKMSNVAPYRNVSSKGYAAMVSRAEQGVVAMPGLKGHQSASECFTETNTISHAFTRRAVQQSPGLISAAKRAFA